jgi:hypothetical protein
MPEDRDRDDEAAEPTQVALAQVSDRPTPEDVLARQLSLDVGLSGQGAFGHRWMSARATEVD